MNLRKDHCRALQEQNDPRTSNSTPLPARGARDRGLSGRIVPPRDEQQTSARDAPRKRNERARPRPPQGRRRGAASFTYAKMTLGNGYLGSRIDEERSEMRYLV